MTSSAQVARQERKLRITVLMGGSSSEREISLATGTMIINALDREKYEVSAIDTRDLARLASESMPVQLESAVPESAAVGGPILGSDVGSIALSTDRSSCQPVHAPATSRLPPDVVVIALHGKGGEDGAVQGMLEVLGLRYTGSGILASALAMDKRMTKRLFRAAGIPVLADLAVQGDRRPSDVALIAWTEEHLGGFPVFVKPNGEGSTFGCSLVHGPENLGQAVSNALQYDRVALIETYVRGREITVGVLGNAGRPLQALPIIEIVPRGEYYDYDSKYADGGSEHIIPARLTVEQTKAAQDIALQCHELLGCRCVSRTDIIARGDGLYVLEVNTIPGMTPTSLLPQAAAHAGIAFPDLLDRLIGDAMI